MPPLVGTGLFLIGFGLWGAIGLGRDRFFALCGFGVFILVSYGWDYLWKKLKARRASKTPPNSNPGS